MGNLLIVFILTVIVGFLLIFLIQKTSKRPETKEEKIPLSSGLTSLNMDQFYSLACQLLEKLGLQITDAHREKDNEVDIHATNPSPLVGGPVTVRLILYPEGAQVNSVEVINFGSELIGDRRGKGIIITTGFFTPDVAVLPELAPMELIDGNKLFTLLKAQGILKC